MAATLEDVAWDLEPLVDGDGEAGADRLLKEAQDRSATFAERYQGQVASIDGTMSTMPDQDGLSERDRGSWTITAA